MKMTITSKKQSQAKADWMAKNSKMFAIRVMKNTEPDLWEMLTSAPEPSKLIKAALRQYTTITTPAKGEKGQGEK